MTKKTVSGLLLALILAPMVSIAFHIQLVETSGLIHIIPDASVDSLKAPMSTIDNTTSAFADFSINRTTNSLTTTLNLVYRPANPILARDHPCMQGYDVLSVSGCEGSTTTPGEPTLPVRTANILLPPKVEVSAELKNCKQTTLEGEYHIFPAQKPTTNMTVYSFTSPDPNIYGLNSKWPSSVFEVVGFRQIREYRIFVIRLFPLSYIPLSRKVIFNNAIELSISFRNNVHVLDSSKRSRIFDNAIMSLVLNPDDTTEFYVAEAAETFEEAQSPAKYIIVTPESFEVAAQPLADWKTTKGINAQVFTVESITSTYTGIDTQEKIRNFLIDCYNLWGTEWVLLAGDVEQVPTRMVYCPDDASSDGDYVPTDYYYADLTGDWDSNGNGLWGETSDQVNWEAEVFVGRLPAQASTELANMVSKTISYEHNPPTGDWTSRMLLAGAYSNYANEDNNGWAKTDEARLKQRIRLLLYDVSYTRLYEKAGVDPSDYDCELPLTEDNVEMELNSGYLLANFAGHGNSYGIHRKVWTADSNGNGVPESGEISWPYMITKSTSFSNDLKPFLAYGDACSSAEIDVSESFGEHVVKISGGAIGYVGATRISWYRVGWSLGEGYNQELDYRFWYWFRSAATDKRPGAALYLSKLWYANTYNTADSAHRKDLFTYLLLGDPEVRIGSGTTYIRANGSIDPLIAPISTTDNITYTFTGDIVGRFVVERSNVTVDGQGHTLVSVPPFQAREGFYSSQTENVTIQNTNIQNFQYGCFINRSSSGNIIGNNVTNFDYGIYLSSSSNNTISGNNITAGYYYASVGVYLSSSSNNTISENNIAATDSFLDCGIRLAPSSEHNAICENNIRNSAEFASGISVSSSSNIISGNNITTDAFIGSCIELWACSNNTLSGNEMRGGWGLDVDGYTLDHYVHSIDTSNLIWSKPVYYLVNQSNSVIALPTQAGYVALINSTNVTVQGQTLTRNGQGILLVFTNNSRILNNTITRNNDGLVLRSSSNNAISANNVTSNYASDMPEGSGIKLLDSSNNTISGNNIAGNAGEGLELRDSPYNTISGNNVTNNYGGVDLHSSDFNIISGNNVTNNYSSGISLDNCSRVTAYGNVLVNSWDGIWIYRSSYNTISENNITSPAPYGVGGWDGCGIRLYYSSYNNISDNAIADHNNENAQYGVRLEASSYNRFYHNIFINNTVQAYNDLASINVWDDGYPSGGNYWGDYAERYPSVGDEYHGANQLVLGNDDVWDSPYEIDVENQDNYPLVEAWSEPTLAGDIDRDGDVDVYDLHTAGSSYGYWSDELEYNRHADLNKDGIVDTRDVEVIAQNYGKTDP